MATKLGSLLIEMGLDSSKFVSGLQRSERQMSGFQRNVTTGAGAVKAALAGMVAVVTAGAFQQAIQRGMDYASSLKEQAMQAGVSAAALQEYRFAATQAGLTAEQMDTALTRLTRTIGQAANGSQAQVQAFARLGVSVRDASGNIRSAADIMPDLAEAIRGLGSEAERGAALNAIFGRSGQALAPLMMEGAAGVNALRSAAHDLGVVLSDDVIEAADGAADRMAAFRMIVDARMAAFVAQNASELDNLTQSLLNVAGAALRAASGLSQMMRRNAEVRAEHERLQRLYNVPEPSLDLGLISFRRRGRNEPRNLANLARSNVAAREMGGVVGNVLGMFGMRATGTRPDRFAAVDLDEPLTGGGGGGRSGGGGGAASRAASETREYESSLQSLLRQSLPVRQAQLDLAEATETLNRALRQGDITITEYNAALRSISDRYANGGQGRINFGDFTQLEEIRVEVPMAQQAIEDLADETVRNARRMEEAAERQQQAMFDMIGSIRNFANSIRGGDVFGIIEGLFGLLESIGGMRNGGLNVLGLQFGRGAHSRIPGYANGTNFAPGGLAWVGERGRELVNLPRGSQVVPNHDLKGLGGMVQIVPSPYFDVVVDGRAQNAVATAAPSIAQAGSQGAQVALARRTSRRLR